MALRSLFAVIVLPLTQCALPEQVSLIPPTVPSAVGHGPDVQTIRQNGPQIFNALHSSMRQWGSSLKHNGMSFFPVTVPANTHLYHGTNNSSCVTGMEWLAFEIEHAEMFARPRHGHGPPGKSPQPGRPKGPGEPGVSLRREHQGAGYEPLVEEHFSRENSPLMREGDSDEAGYLHVYQTTRELSRLLYIDGMSAGKTSMGTLDTTDYVLREGGGTTAPWGDYNRAQELCVLGSDWGIEGFLRMEAGFEIILCNFTNGLVLESARQTPNFNERGNSVDIQHFEYARAVASRYQGITANRVVVDYSSMVSAYFYPLNLTNPVRSRPDLPRLISSDPEDKARLRKDLHQVLTRNKYHSHPVVDWQGVVDIIVTRYSNRLQFIAAETTFQREIISELHSTLDIYIDYNQPDLIASEYICTHHFLKSVILGTEQDHFIYEAVKAVTQKICGTLFSIRKMLLAAEKNKLDLAVLAKSAVKDLIAELDWSTWLECGKCGYGEVCYVAVWPWGRKEDHDRPSCVKYNETSGRNGYWDMGH
jgi:hypothetical protein